MLIEFIGLPGGGKTSLANYQSKLLEIPLVNIHNRGEKILYSFLFLVKHPRLFFFFLRNIIKETKHYPYLLKHKFLFLFIRAIAKEKKAQKYPSCIIDEGLLQFTFFSLYERIISESEVEILIKRISNLSDRDIFIIKAPKRLRRLRMEKRKRVPRSSFGLDYKTTYHNYMENNSIIANKILINKKRVYVIYNNNFEVAKKLINSCFKNKKIV
jgi:hypothetical protein